MRRAALFALPCLVLGCGHDEPAPGPGDPPWVPPPESCAAADLDDPTRLGECSLGSGIFGRWTLDDRGLPAYDYRLDQHADARASYPVSESDEDGEELDPREHWAAFGNHRVNAHFFNDGPIELVTQDRGVEYLNKVDESQQAFGGGFGWLYDGEERWCTAYKWRPEGARTSRRFGMGYAESSLEHRSVRVTRVTAAPPGDEPVLVSDVTIENLGAEPRELVHWEYWDVHRRPIEINWVVAGDPFENAPRTARALRDGRNALFQETASWDSTAALLSIRRAYVGAEPRPAREAPSAADYWPNEPFLLAPLGGVSDVFVSQASFFGVGPVAQPDAVLFDSPGEGAADGVIAETTGAGQPLLLAMKSELSLGAHEKRTLRFVYGYAEGGGDFPDQPFWREPSYDARAAQADALADDLFYFAEPSAPELGRELPWHSYQIEASVGRREYWQGHVVPQGSAYLYLHGADGAARDLGLFAVPLVYTHPELAREELLLFMGIQFADERFSYAFQGHGELDDAGIHSAPSDLPIFFLWALGEYLGATGDLAFLDQKAPYYPREARPDATVWEHVLGAARHLFDVVGTGEHGLVRIGTGDWSDGIVMEAPDRKLAVEKGESVPNTQMAIAVLPRMAELVEGRDPALAQEIRTRVEGYRDALKQAWTGEHFVRAYFGDGEPHHAGTIDLEAQIWALIGGSFDAPSDRETLIAKIAEKLDEPSPIGGTLTPGAQVWPAISAPLTWGYSLSDPTRAWAHFKRNSMTAHARAFPEVWYGIWSGPDGVSSKSGWAWASQVTPMTDFPVQNNNYHSMPLLAALRIAGIDATASGLRIAPRIPSRTFSLRSRLIDLEQRDERIAGTYRPSGSEDRLLVVEAPPGEHVKSASANGKTATVPPGSSSIVLSASGALSFEVETE